MTIGAILKLCTMDKFMAIGALGPDSPFGMTEGAISIVFVAFQ